MHLTVTDFQSLGHVAVEVSGLTVLVGPSNRGKSALIRALEAVLFNKPGDEFVRTGKKKARVEIVNAPTADGKALLDVAWTKGGGKTIYDLSGDLYTKVGQGTPPVITEAGYRDVWIGDKDRKKGEWLRPQVSEQGPGTYFLLNRPGSFVSDVLGAISRHAVLLTAQGRAAGDHRGAKQALGYKQTDLTRAHEQLDALDAVPAFVARVEALVAAQEAANVLRGKVARVKAILSWRAAYSRLAAFQTADVWTVGAIYEGLDTVEVRASAYERAVTLAAARPNRLAVGGSAVPSATVVPVDLGDIVRRATVILTRRAAFAELMPFRVRYEAPDVAAVERQADAVAKARGLSWHRPKVAALAACTVPAVGLPWAETEHWQRQTAQLADTVGRRAQTLDMVYRCETAVKSTKVEVDETRAALTALLADLKVCPTCERPM